MLELLVEYRDFIFFFFNFEVRRWTTHWRVFFVGISYYSCMDLAGRGRGEEVGSGPPLENSNSHRKIPEPPSPPPPFLLLISLIFLWILWQSKFQWYVNSCSLHLSIHYVIRNWTSLDIKLSWINSTTKSRKIGA